MTEAIRGRKRPYDSIDQVWERFVQDRSQELRDALILHYAPVVKYVAGRLGAGLPQSVESQDLVSYGTIGLIDAINKFSLEHGVRFETYATPRIRGAIIDELRRLDWVPRRVRAKIRLVKDGLAALEHRLQRSATEEELAAAIDLTVAEVRSTLDDLAAASVVELDDPTSPAGLLGMAHDSPDPSEEVAIEESQHTVRAAIKALPERERHVLALYYFESLNLRQIGEILEVSEARISQIRAKALLSLRNRLTPYFTH